MKFLITAFAFLTISEASAQRGCYQVSRGVLLYDKNIGVMYGKYSNQGYVAELRVSCTRGSPTFLTWRGGLICTGDYIKGRSLIGRRFSCLVRSVANKKS